MRGGLRLAGVAAVAALTGCGLLPFQPARTSPDDPIRAVIELGRGTFEGRAWRYVTYEGPEGTCVSIEWEQRAGSDMCGVSFFARGRALALMGTKSSRGEPTVVAGTVSGEVAAVVVVTEDGMRMPGVIMSLGPIGLETSAFVALIPEHTQLTSVLALDESGAELASEPLSGPD